MAGSFRVCLIVASGDRRLSPDTGSGEYCAVSTASVTTWRRFCDSSLYKGCSARSRTTNAETDQDIAQRRARWFVNGVDGREKRGPEQRIKWTEYRAPVYNSSTSRRACSTACKSSDDSSPRRRSSLCLVIARIWSVTATTSRSLHRTRTSNGAPGRGEVESGITTTVRRSLLKTSRERIRQGRVLAISEPSVESRRTHQISPRRASTIALVWRRTDPPEHRRRSLSQGHRRICSLTRKPGSVVLPARATERQSPSPHTVTCGWRAHGAGIQESGPVGV